MKRLFLILLIFFNIFIIGCSSQNILDLGITPEIQSCINNYNNYQDWKPGERFVPGQISVDFKNQKEMSNKEIENILKPYNLEIKKIIELDNSPLLVVVSVPNNKEIEWVCRLRRDINIEKVEFDFILSPQRNDF
jgi:hypothetical protein